MMNTIVNIARVFLVLLLLGCALTASVFLAMLFGANPRTICVAAGLISAVGLLACAIDRGVHSEFCSHSDSRGAYAAGLKRIVILLSIVLGAAVAIFAGQVVLAVYRSIK